MRTPQFVLEKERDLDVWLNKNIDRCIEEGQLWVCWVVPIVLFWVLIFFAAWMISLIKL